MPQAKVWSLPVTNGQTFVKDAPTGDCSRFSDPRMFSHDDGTPVLNGMFGVPKKGSKQLTIRFWEIPGGDF